MNIKAHLRRRDEGRKAARLAARSRERQDGPQPDSDALERELERLRGQQGKRREGGGKASEDWIDERG